MDKVLVRQPVIDLPARTVTREWAAWFDQIVGELATLEARPAGSGGTATSDEVLAALALKADRAHSHTIGDIIGLVSALASKAASGHTHAWGSITGTLSDQLDLQAALDGKANLIRYNQSLVDQ